jgi:hypothetical protein
VPKKYFKPPREVIKEWPEVLGDIYVSTMPIKYIRGVELSFSDGRIWEIDIEEQLEFNDEDEIIEKIMMAFRDYQDEIVTINFQIDVDRIKNDVTNKTKGILGEK